jgi:hypothetical protein
MRTLANAPADSELLIDRATELFTIVHFDRADPN